MSLKTKKTTPPPKVMKKGQEIPAKKKVSPPPFHFFLLRGLTREAAHWGNFSSLLQERLKNIDISYLESPGTGQQLDTPCPKTISEMVIAMRPQFLKAQKTSQAKTKVFVASSLGGIIASEWMRIYPEDFQKVILINTSFRGLMPFYRRVQPRGILMFLYTFFTTSIEKREKNILGLVSNAKEKHRDFLPQWVAIQKQRTVKRSTAFNQIVAAARFKTKLEKPPADVLLIAAKKDKIADYQCSVKLSNLWNVDLALHEDSGHEMAIDAPQWLIDTFATWVLK